MFVRLCDYALRRLKQKHLKDHGPPPPGWACCSSCSTQRTWRGRQCWWPGDQSEISIQVTRSILTNRRSVFTWGASWADKKLNSTAVTPAAVVPFSDTSTYIAWSVVVISIKKLFLDVENTNLGNFVHIETIWVLHHVGQFSFVLETKKY